jgi:small subunit ribosomal protein S18
VYPGKTFRAWKIDDPLPNSTSNSLSVTSMSRVECRMPTMPPPLQCLNASRLFGKQSLLSKAAFSTTAKASAGQTIPDSFNSLNASLHQVDEPSSSATDLLSSILDHPRRIVLPVHNRRTATPASPSPLAHRQPQQGNAQANRRAANLIQQAGSRAAARKDATGNLMQDLKKHKLASDLTKQITRRWKVGDVYAPHDLSSAEMQKWKRRGRLEHDVFDLLDLNPIEEYKVCSPSPNREIERKQC